MTITAPAPRTCTPALSTGGAVVLLTGTALSNVIFGAAALVAPLVTEGLGHPSAGAAGLFVAVFSAGFASVLVLAGRLGDRYGRRRLFRLGLCALAVSSLAVAAAPTLPFLFALRGVQGLATGLMLPQALSTIHATTTGHRRAQLTATYVAVVGLGTTIGQLSAGAIASLGRDAWRWTFVAIAVVALLAAAFSGLVAETRTASSERTDVIGSALVAGALVSLIVPVGLGRSLGWPWWTWTSLAVGILAAAALLLRESRLPEDAALIPLTAMRSRPLRAGLALTVIFFVGYGAFVFWFSSAFGPRLGLTPLKIALALVPFALAFVTGTLSSPRLAARFAPARLMRGAACAQFLCLTALAIAIWVLWPSLPLLLLEVVLMALGFAQALMYAPLLGAIMSSLPHTLVGVASGLVSTVQQTGLALGVAIIAVIADLLSHFGSRGIAASLMLGLALALAFAAIVGTVDSKEPA